MTDKESNDSRRKLLKSIAAGSGAVVAGKSLPESWTKPVVDAVLLPVHATTTDATGGLPDANTTQPPVTNPCVGESATIGADKYGILIVYDGVSSPYFAIRNQASSGLSEDTVVSVAKTPSFAIGPRRNWETGVPRIESDVADGLYTRTITRMVGDQPTGDRFDLTFCIATAGEDASRTLTVTLVSINRI